MSLRRGGLQGDTGDHDRWCRDTPGTGVKYTRGDAIAGVSNTVYGVRMFWIDRVLCHLAVPTKSVNRLVSAQLPRPEARGPRSISAYPLEVPQ